MDSFHDGGSVNHYLAVTIYDHQTKMGESAGRGAQVKCRTGCRQRRTGCQLDLGRIARSNRIINRAIRQPQAGPAAAVENQGIAGGHAVIVPQSDGVIANIDGRIRKDEILVDQGIFFDQGHCRVIQEHEIETGRQSALLALGLDLRPGVEESGSNATAGVELVDQAANAVNLQPLNLIRIARISPNQNFAMRIDPRPTADQGCRRDVRIPNRNADSDRIGARAIFVRIR